MRKIVLPFLLLLCSTLLAKDIATSAEGFARKESSSMDRFYGDANVEASLRPFATHTSSEYGFDNKTNDIRQAVMVFKTEGIDDTFYGTQLQLNVKSGGGKTYIYAHNSLSLNTANVAATRPTWNNLYSSGTNSTTLLDSIVLVAGSNTLRSEALSQKLKDCINNSNKDLVLVIVSALSEKTGRTVLQWASSDTPCLLSTITSSSALMSFQGDKNIFYGDSLAFDLKFIGTAPYTATIAYDGTESIFSGITSSDTTVYFTPTKDIVYALTAASDAQGSMDILDNGLSIIKVKPLSGENDIISTMVGQITQSTATLEQIPLGLRADMLAQMINVSEHASFSIVNGDTSELASVTQALEPTDLIEVVAQNGDLKYYNLVFTDKHYNSNDTITGKVKTVNNLTFGRYILDGKSELHVTAADKPILFGSVDLVSEDAWLYFDNIKPQNLVNNYLDSISVFGEPAVHGQTVRVVQYVSGSVVIPHGADYLPVEVFDGQNLSGNSLELEPYKIYNIADLGDMNDAIRSFKVKKGYYVTMAQNEKGMGYSRVFLAHDEDLTVNIMPEPLDTAVSFLRVIPWRWPNKKGYPHGQESSFNSGWRYNWSAGKSSTLDVEYVPIQQKLHWPGTSSFYVEDVTHLLGMNEPDRPDQANCTVEEALAVWPKLMATGLRLGSPSPSDGGLNWLFNFIDECDKRNYRVDFVAMHWYLGCQSAQSFYDRCKYVHERTGRPIWITEWNNGADWTNGCKPSTQEGNAAKIQSFLDKLDGASFVERYCIFDWLSGGSYSTWSLWEKRYNDETLTPTGLVYRNQPSPMSYNPNKEFIGPYVELMAPTGLKANLNTSTGSVQLTWDDVSVKENGVKIERSTNGGAYVKIANIQEADITSYTDSVSTYGAYSYRLRQYIVGKSNSDYSNIASISKMKTGDKIISYTKPATASSERGAYPASNATNVGKTNTSRWLTAEGVSFPQWLEIDLESAYEISYIKIYTGYDGYNGPINDFKFQYWDGSQWQNLLDITGNTNPKYEGGFTPVVTNKVRLYVTKSTENTVKLYELEVFGTASSSLSHLKKLRTLDIYPNPANTSFSIAGLDKAEQVIIYDLTGKQVYSQMTDNTVNISSLKSGVYIVKLESSAPMRLIKE